MPHCADREEPEYQADAGCGGGAVREDLPHVLLQDEHVQLVGVQDEEGQRQGQQSLNRLFEGRHQYDRISGGRHRQQMRP